MAESEQDKSEQPTSYKLMQSRRKGAVARGMDLGFFTAIAVFLGYAWMTGPHLGQILAWQMQAAIVASGLLADGPTALATLTERMLGALIKPVLLLVIAMLVITMLFEIVQTGIVFSSQPLKPDFSRLNPVQGLKRVFSMRMLIETAKNVLKLLVYTFVGVLIIRSALQSDVAAIDDAASLSALIVRTGMRLLASFALIAFFFAVADQIISRKQFLKKMRMSRREVRREARDREGEPRLKQKRKQLHSEFVKVSQSLRNLRGADVLVVNPQHIAIGLRYDPSAMPAPTVISMGTNGIAQRMKRMAVLYMIPVIEDRALARELHRKAVLGAYIPEHCFAPTAAIYNKLRRAKRAPISEQQDAQ